MKTKKCKKGRGWVGGVLRGEREKRYNGEGRDMRGGERNEGINGRVPSREWRLQKRAWMDGYTGEGLE